MDFQIYPLCVFDGGKSQSWHLAGVSLLRCYTHKTAGLALLSPLAIPSPPLQALLPIFPAKSQRQQKRRGKKEREVVEVGGEVRKRPAVRQHRGSAPEVIRETILGVRNHPPAHL